MIDLNEKLSQVITHPILTGAAGATVTTMGALNKFAESLPWIHDMLSDLSMLIGVATCIAAFIVQIRIAKIKAVELEHRQMKRDQFARDFMHQRKDDDKPVE